MAQRKKPAPAGPKYQSIFSALVRDIQTGKYKPGQRLPSEAALVRKFLTSRITVGRALRELKERGMVERIAGSGTYVSRQVPSSHSAVFGLLIPDLGSTEIFEPICQGMASSPEATKHALLWGRAESSDRSKDEQAIDLCEEYISRGVAGVFFAPLELTPQKDLTNRTILRRFEEERMPVVLLDRDVTPFPSRSRHDLVGINNRRAGYLITDHLLEHGCQNLVFIARQNGATTIDARIAGFQEALLARGLPLSSSAIQRVTEIDEHEVGRIIRKLHPKGFVCVNDQTAAEVMQAVIALGLKIPRDIRIVGIDDVGFAKLLPVPLTTIRQPCRDIGQVAMAAMHERIARPQLPAREILLDSHVVVRESCGCPKNR